MRRRDEPRQLRRAAAPGQRGYGLRALAHRDDDPEAATLMLGRGVNPKIVSEMLGHSSVAITLDLYSHATPTMQREAAEGLDAALWG